MPVVLRIHHAGFEDLIADSLGLLQPDNASFPLITRLVSLLVRATLHDVAAEKHSEDQDDCSDRGTRVCVILDWLVVFPELQRWVISGESRVCEDPELKNGTEGREYPEFPFSARWVAVE